MINLAEEYQALNFEELFPALTVILDVAGDAVRIIYLIIGIATRSNPSAKSPMPLRITFLQVDNDSLMSYFAAAACVFSQDAGRIPERGSR